MADDIEIKIVGKDESAKALADAEQGILGVGQAAEKAGPKIKGLGDQTGRVHKVIGDGGRQFGDYGHGLGGVGDRADEVDTRMMGLSDGIQGVTDLMGGNGKLKPHEMAMAFSDLGSAAYNTVVPSLQSVGKQITGLLEPKKALTAAVEKYGAGSAQAAKASEELATRTEKLKSVAIGAGVAIGAAGLVLALKQYNDAADEARGKDLADEFEKTGKAAEVMAEAAAGDVFALGDMFNAFDALLEKSPELAQQFLNAAQKAGVYNDEQRKSAQAAIDAASAADTHSEALVNEAEKIRGVADAHRAQLDPLFGVVDALHGVDDAQRGVDDALAAYNTAVKEHGRGSTEATDALRGLRDAQDDTVRSAFDLEGASSDLAAQISEHPATLSNAMLALEQWRQQGIITEDEARRMAIKFGNAADKANDFAGPYHASLSATDHATGVIRPVADRLSQLDGQNANVSVTARAIFGPGLDLVLALGGFGGRAAGGPVGAAAGGGVHRGKTLVGERGPELVDLQPGTMVTPASNTGQMLGSGGGGGVTVIVQGSVITERELVDVFRDVIRDNYGGDVQRALGWG